MYESGQGGALELFRNPGEMFRLFGVGSVHRTSAFIMAGCVANSAFKSDTNGREPARFHPLTERFGDAPAVIRNHHCTGNGKGGWFTRTGFNFNLPATGAGLMGRWASRRLNRR